MFLRALVVLVTVAVSFSVALSAQVISGGSVSGYVTDAQGRFMPGVTIRASATAPPGRYTVVTDAYGFYRVSNLSPAAYTVSAELPGFAPMTRDGIVLREGLNIRLDLMLSIGPVSQSVNVLGQAPMLESKTATTTVNIGGDFQRALPMSGLRTWSDFLLLTPGVATMQGRFQTYALHGTAHGSSVLLVDGADATSVLQGSTLYSQFSSETFSDIQVKTGAVDAASPLGLGPIVNIVTQSGANQPHGAIGLTFQPRRWNGDNAAGGQSVTVQTRQLDLGIGTPIRRDRLWLFGSLRVARNHTGVPRSADQVGYLRALKPDFTQFDNPWEGQFGFAKLTGQLGARTRLLASYSRDVLTLGGAQPFEAANFRNFVTGGPGYFARVSSAWSDGLTTSLSVGYNGKTQKNVNTQPATTGVAVYSDVFPFGMSLFGSGLVAVLDASPYPGMDFRAHAWTVAGDATFYRTGRFGSHELRAGAYLQPRRQNRQLSTYNNNGYQLEEAVLRDPDNPSAGVVPFHRQMFGVAELTTTDVNSSDNALYLQDAWAVAPRLTLTLGLRADFVKRVDQLFDVTTQESTEVGPRLGINYMITADQRNGVRASWSRVHENLSVNETQAGTSVAAVVDGYDAAGDGSFSTVIATPASTAIASDVMIDIDGYHQEHVDEAVVGYRRQLPGQATVDISASRRAYRDRPAAVESNGIYSGSRFVGYRDPTRNEVYRLTANTWNWPVATAFQIQAAKRSSRLTLLAAYTREWNHLAGTWQPNDPASFIQPGAFANSNGIGYVDGCTSGSFCQDSNSLSGAPGGGTWRSHVGNLGVSVQGPWRLQLATNYNYQSGPWSGPIYLTRSAPDPTFGPPAVTLANGRTVSNPLATPMRFAFETRGEGQIQLGALHLWNVRIGGSFPMGGRRLETALDVLNVTNHGADQAFEFGANVQGSPFFGQGSSRQFPRAVQISARFVF